MREVAADRERRRREDPGARWSGICLREQIRRPTAASTCSCSDVAEDLDPAHAVSPSQVPALAPARRARDSSRSRASRAALQAFGALGRARRAASASASSAAAQRSSAVGEAALRAQRLRQRRVPLPSREHEAQLARAASRARRAAFELGHAPPAARSSSRVSRASSTSCAVDSLAEEQRAVSGSWCASSRIDRVAGGQQLGDAFVAQHDVGEEQVVVDDDDVGLERVLARLHHEALVVVRAVLAEAVLARRRHVRPDGGVLRHVGELGAVAASAACARSATILRRCAHVLARRQAGPRARRALEMVWQT